MTGGWAYIMTDRYRGTLYIGVTSDIAARVFAHREGRGSRFCARYGLTRLVYAEQAPTIEEAIARERDSRFRGNDETSLIAAFDPLRTELLPPGGGGAERRRGVPDPSVIPDQSPG